MTIPWRVNHRVRVGPHLKVGRPQAKGIVVGEVTVDLCGTSPGINSSLHFSLSPSVSLAHSLSLFLSLSHSRARFFFLSLSLSIFLFLSLPLYIYISLSFSRSLLHASRKRSLDTRNFHAIEQPRETVSTPRIAAERSPRPTSSYMQA